MSDPSRASRLDPPASNPSNRVPRSSVMLLATVEHGRGHGTSHRVRDVSAGGIRIDNASGLTAGTTVSLSVGPLRAIVASVRWVRSGCAGLAFADPVDPEMIRKKPVTATKVSARPTSSRIDKAVPAPTAGWIDDLRDAYVR